MADYFANGRENHIAQIAPAGSWRVWAEPETGGEAYIPFAPEKRARSLEIWEETGKRLNAFGWDGANQAAADSFRTNGATLQPRQLLSGQMGAGQIVLPPTEVVVTDFEISNWEREIAHLTVKVGSAVAGSVNYATVGGD